MSAKFLSRRGLYVAAVSALGFVLLAVLVAQGATTSFDEAVLRALRRPTDLAILRGPSWTGGAIRDLTALGSEAVLVVVVAVVASFLAMRGHRASALVVAVGAAGGVAVDLVLKQVAGRPRPEIVPRLVEASWTSFPSGHAMLSATIYLTLGALLSRFSEEPRMKRFFLATGCALTGLVGLSRIALGVHYPTDVLAGWFAGASWAGLCWFLAAWLQWRGEVDRDAAG